jgi:hypothetical protein
MSMYRRIPSLQTLGREVLALFHERSAKAIKIKLAVLHPGRANQAQ